MYTVLNNINIKHIMLKYIKILLGIIIVAFVLSVILQKDKKVDQKTFIIGASQALTGSAAYYGEQTQKGINLGIDWLKEKYPEYTFKVISEDNQFNAKVAIDNYNKLVNQDKIDAIITHNSPSSVAIAPLAKRDGILQIAISAAASTYSSPDDLSFRTTGVSSDEVIPMSKYISSKYKKIAILFMNNEIGTSEANDLTELLNKESNIKIVSNESFAVENKDFRTQIAKLKSLSPDAVYIAGLASHIIDFVKQTKELHLTYPILSFRTAEDPSIFSSLVNDANGIIFTNFFDSYASSTEISKMVNIYKKTFNRNPDSYVAEGYEATRLVGTALVRCKKDETCIKKFFAELPDFDSIFGEIKYDINGDIHHKYILQKIDGENFITIN